MMVVNTQHVKNKKFNTRKTEVKKMNEKILNATISIQINKYNAHKQSLEKKLR